MLKGKEKVPSDESSQKKPILLWPGMVIVVVQWLVRFVIPFAFPGASTGTIGVIGGILGGLAIVVWWAFFSRAPRPERWGAIVLMIVVLVATSRFIDESIKTGFQGMMFYVYAIPVLSLAFVLWAVTSYRLSNILRRSMMAATILLACGAWTLLRSDGITGDGAAYFSWRWSETPEERFLAQSGDLSTPTSPVLKTAEFGTGWPGFRGPARDGIIRGLRIDTDWITSSPVELWRRPIGPGCSSFAVLGDLFYTQEQHEDNEVIACYNVTNGKLVWRHLYSARFWDSHAGAGPRGTPTLSDGRLYTLGATGILNVLDASNGDVLWSRNASSDTDIEIQGWGFTSSPLVIDDLVIVAIAGTLVACDIVTGDLRWIGPNGGSGYSSPHQLTIDGVTQILLMSEIGATSVAPTDGKVLWKHEWPNERIVQPVQISDGDLLLSIGGIKGVRRISVANGPDGWTIQEHWMSAGLRPNFNDIVVHKGHAYGFNGPSLACIDIEDGQRKWRSGRYGGQIVLLADQDLLLVLTEKGELALVAADPDQFNELARLPAIEGKTWNHPALADDVILVRNSQEMAAFRLPLTGS